MSTCIYSKVQFDSADGEHVLQNFLGARWVSKEITCNEVQELFGQTIDLALEQGLREFRNLLGVKGGRGGEGPSLKNVVGSRGTKYHLLPGGIPHLAQPVITTHHHKNGVQEVFTQIGDMNQLDWALSELRKKFPKAALNTDELRERLKSEKQYLNEKIHLRSSIGGSEYFRGLLKAAFNLLGANASDVALLPCFDALRRYVLSGEGDAANHIRWLAAADDLTVSKIGHFDHFVGVYSRGQYVDGIVQFFGGVSHIVRLTDGYEGPDFCFGYQVEPLRESSPAEIRNPSFNPEQLPRFIDGYSEPGPVVWPIYSAIFTKFLKAHSEMAFEKEISRIVDEILNPHMGEIMSTHIWDELAEQMAKFIVTRVRRV